MRKKVDVVHLYLPDGTVACRGLDVVGEDGELLRIEKTPLKLTIRIDDVNCPVCRRVAARRGLA